MRAFPLLITAVIILGVAVTALALASGWSTASINLNTNANPVITYSISTGTYRENATFVNYTALMLQSIKYDIEHHILLNQTQLSYLVFLQALANQPSNMPSIVNVTIVSTGVQPMYLYASYEVFLINATLSSPAPTLLFYEVPTYWLGTQQPLFLVALPGSRYAIAYEVLWESSSACIAVFGHYGSSMGILAPLSLYLWETVGFGLVNNYYSCTNTALYEPSSLVININGVNYTLSFEPYEGTSIPNPPLPNTIVLNVTAYTGSIGIYDVPFTTPLLLCGSTSPYSCESSDAYLYAPPPGYTPVVWSKYLSPVIYENMPAILLYPTQPGLYAYPNTYTPRGAIPSERFLVVYANVTGPTVVPKELFSVTLPYGTCYWMPINATPLQLSSVANYGYLAQISGSSSSWSINAYAIFDGVVAGYNTSEPGFVSAVLDACDMRGFWALMPVTLNITLTDEYGYPVGYGLVTLGPNYSAWLTIVLAISAIGSGAYILITKLRGGRGEVVIRL